MREIPEREWRTLPQGPVPVETGRTLLVNDDPRPGKQSQHILPKGMAEEEFQKRFHVSYFVGMTNKEAISFIQSCIGKGITIIDINGGVSEIVRIAHIVGKTKMYDGSYVDSKTVVLEYNKQKGVHGFPCEDIRYERGR